MNIQTEPGRIQADRKRQPKTPLRFPAVPEKPIRASVLHADRLRTLGEALAHDSVSSFQGLHAFDFHARIRESAERILAVYRATNTAQTQGDMAAAIPLMNEASTLPRLPMTDVHLVFVEATHLFYVEGSADCVPLYAHVVELSRDFASPGDTYITELQQFIDDHSRLLLSLVVAQIFTAGSLKGVGEIDSLRAYFERGAAMMSNRVDKDPQVDPAFLVRVSFAAVLGCVMFKDWIFPPGLASDDEISAAIIDFVIDGINVNSDPGMRSPGNNH